MEPPVRARVLIAAAEAAVAARLAAALEGVDAEVSQVASASATLQNLERAPAEVLLLSTELDESLWPQVRHRWPEVQVILQGPSEDDAAARDAITAGASDYLSDASDPGVVRRCVVRALALAVRVAAQLPVAATDGGMVGDSEPMRRTLELVRRVAPKGVNVLVRGESGTGKELVARALHQHGRRSGGPFVTVHSAALPDNLLESELFGYERGAFTGATARKPGRVDAARGGTLFLDEIGDISATMQVKLLRLLQEKQYERLGGNDTIEADVRFVAATHRNLEAMVGAGEFREDLFYRLNVVTVWLPPLRARRGDIPALVDHFCRCSDAAVADAVRFDPAAVALLQEQRWPGNVRQLQNFVERLLVLSQAPIISAQDVRAELNEEAPFQTGTVDTHSADAAPTSSVLGLEEQVAEAEIRALKKALKRADNNRSKAARLLGIGRRTFYTKLAQYGLS